jgi:hypothetical protein
MMFTSRDVRMAASLFLLLVLLVLIYIHETSKKILSLKLAPNLCERMEKNRERMENNFHPFTEIGAKSL